MKEESEKLVIEMYTDDGWIICGHVSIHLPKKSFYSKSTFEYDNGFFMKYAHYDESVGNRSVSLCLNLDLSRSHYENWPSFLLDLMPQGYARDLVCKREKIVNNQENDIIILKSGGINPIGNIRIQNLDISFETDKNKGFERQDLIDRNESFLEYAASYGAIVIGASGAQGVAPKFLLNTDHDGKWHCDGAISEKNINELFLVKLKRGNTQDDIHVLEAENLYMKIAGDLGVNTNQGLTYQSGLLFIPRFDRKMIGGKLVCYGMESFSSALGHYEFGKSEKHEVVLELINKFSSHKKEDLKEYIFRDFLNIVMGNTDNHLRNTAFIKYSTTNIRISPLFDFAPMVIDPEIVPRVCKWKNESGYIPSFQDIHEELLKYNFSNKDVIEFFINSLTRVQQIEKLFLKYKVSQRVSSSATRLLNEFIQSLKSYTDMKGQK